MAGLLRKSISRCAQNIARPSFLLPNFAEASSVSRTSGCGIQQQLRNAHVIINQHRDTDFNNPSLTWDFTPENYKHVNAWLAKYPTNYKQSAVIPLLDLAQQQNQGWIPVSAMNKIAEIVGVANMRVYEVVTFYSMFNRNPVGKYHVMVCGTSPCMVAGARDIEAAMEKHLGIKKWETTADGMFTLGEMECMGCCVNAPMVAVADYTNGVEGYSYNYYEDLTPASTVKILDMLKKGEKPKVGSQTRETCEPMGGRTTLLEDPPGPYCRDLETA
mmetsp:Transcript_32365/g.44886  ORF Transcript_32365/g.44886 Transcript_32365/m.44886 type:complete len:273 (+) Transcript_32365:86-904(+)|eukprot:CAMPEP_0196571240 /NCGR_PEP_ID=MMETSP1081-20130531/1424_1 /TAXON_ID=36882 /ORGANISM="Pyramimonas amylifera, Strain CCMP720" /LENGTH=272 /DNA_ID=CAMNT_0041888105 /DNA_START=86 /DNA_END=904 /DNA_ORIENTATION=+